MNVGPQCLTRQRIWRATRLLARGRTKAEVIAHLQQQEDIGYAWAKKICQWASKELTASWEQVERPQLTATILSASLAQAKAATEAGDAAGAAAHLANIAKLARLS